jgi:hypothetical protein
VTLCQGLAHVTGQDLGLDLAGYRNLLLQQR